jgi:DNA-binding winged helix-turn-helix (wHTH) protein
VLSKAQILDRVWNYDFGGQAHVVELYISYLRKKIDAGRDPLIHTVRGVGYVLKPAANAARAQRPPAGGRGGRAVVPDHQRQAHRRAVVLFGLAASWSVWSRPSH